MAKTRPPIAKRGGVGSTDGPATTITLVLLASALVVAVASFVGGSNTGSDTHAARNTPPPSEASRDAYVPPITRKQP